MAGILRPLTLLLALGQAACGTIIVPDTSGPTYGNFRSHGGA